MALVRATLRRFGLEAVKAVARVSSLDLAKQPSPSPPSTFNEILPPVLPGEGSDKQFPGNSSGESNSKQADLSIGEGSGEQVGGSVCEGGSQEIGVGGSKGGGKGVFASFSQGNPEEVPVHTVGKGSAQQVGLGLGQGNLQQVDESC